MSISRVKELLSALEGKSVKVIVRKETSGNIFNDAQEETVEDCTIQASDRQSNAVLSFPGERSDIYIRFNGNVSVNKQGKIVAKIWNPPYKVKLYLSVD